MFVLVYIALATICGNIYVPLWGNQYKTPIGQGHQPTLPKKIAIAIAALVLPTTMTLLPIPAQVTDSVHRNLLPHLIVAATATCGARAPPPGTPTAPAEKRTENVMIAGPGIVRIVPLKPV